MRIIILLFATLLLGSCRTGMGVRKSKVAYFDSSFSATVSNYSFKVKGRSYGDLTLLDLFEVRYENADSVSIFFNDSNQLILVFGDTGQKIEKVFSGKFADKGYYEIYFRNKKNEIPPLFHIIYGNNDINRLRLALTNEGDLIIDNMWDQTFNIFILGAGSSGRRLSYFECNLTN
ncbi:MAG: hypothetical protein ACYC1Q_11675 [Bacteroidia bacterium]